MYVRTRLGRWFYEERGTSPRPEAPAIVLLHGLLFDGGMWRGCLEPLAELGRVLVLDGPGHGKSERPPLGFTLEDHAVALGEALDALDVRRAVLCGVSWGGMLAMRFALAAPERVAGLALVDTSAAAEGPRKRLQYTAFVALHRAVGMPRALYRWRVARLMYGDRTLRERQDLVERAYARTMGFDREGVARAAEAVVIHRSDVTARLGVVDAPTLVLCGREDRATPLARSQEIARGIRGAELQVLDGLGHMAVVEDPAVVNTRLVPWVRARLG